MMLHENGKLRETEHLELTPNKHRRHLCNHLFSHGHSTKRVQFVYFTAVWSVTVTGIVLYSGSLCNVSTGICPQSVGDLDNTL